jgi:hypothetical protein
MKCRLLALAAFVVLTVCPTAALAAVETETLTGIFGVTPLEGGCTQLEADGTLYELYFPDGYRVDYEQGVLYGPDGAAIVQSGDPVSVRGTRPPNQASICQIGVIFDVEAIRPIHP